MATPESTEKYFRRLAHHQIPGHAVRILGRTEFHVSSIGFGGYRVHSNSVEHARALRYALINGVNLVDTSSNYSDGGSEMLIGNLLQEMMAHGEIEREEVVVVSKVGYVQGQNMKLVQENEALGRPFPEMVKYMDGCWHCIHPDFLQEQLTHSLDRLRLPSLDIYLLHNPEYFLSDANKRSEMDLETARDDYIRRLQAAFEWMEEKVAEGKIKAYGISSNTFPISSDDFEFTSLEKVIATAEYVASSNYFQVIQFPFNLYEAGACKEQNQCQGQKTLLQLAANKSIATLVNRPLNAMTKNGMQRLADFRTSEPKDVQQAFKKALTVLAGLEQQFSESLIEKAPQDIPKENLRQVFSLSSQLANALTAFQNWHNWDHVKQNIILPQTTSYLNYLDRKLQDEPTWKQWSISYADGLRDLLDAVTKHFENDASELSKAVVDTLDDLSAALESSDTLSQKAVRVLTSTPGIHCVLMGMRKIPYVEDALAALKQDPVENSKEILTTFNDG
ncbi:MAG: aldo/keto reductase [bacterium]